MIGFSHLHVHTQYSILDGASHISDLISQVKEYGMNAIAITDHGNMFGVKEFYNTAMAHKIKPIIGCEIYTAARSRFDHSEKEDRSGNHLILLAKNKTGYYNLIKLVSLAWIEGFYYKPRIDRELLKKYSEGIIVSTACIAGEIPRAILNGNVRKAEEIILEYKELFGEDFYLELIRHFTGNPDVDKETYEQQETVNRELIKLSAIHKVKLIATNDVHFIHAQDAEAHDRLICLNTNQELDSADRLRYTKQEYLKTPEQMAELFKDIPEAILNTMELTDKIEVYELNHEPLMPDFPLPEGFTNEFEYLQHLTMEGAKDRYSQITSELKERLDFELSVINNMGYPGYFLIVQDFINQARKMSVSVGPGRGSVAGSVVAYCIKITNIDPLKYNLLFERFLNPERVSLPDIDIDFDEDGREKVIEYVVQKYGFNKVAQIITFGTMAAKMAIRDIARVEKLPLPEADRLAKLVPDGPKVTLKKAYAEVKELQDARKSGNDLVERTLKYAEVLEGSVRQTGLHACGIIIGKDDLIEHIPLCKSKESNLYVTQFDGKHVEDVGMLKMDLLGLKTLSIIKDALHNIKQSKNSNIDIDSIPLDDEKTYELYSRGETTGLFQFESAGMKKYLKNLKPNRFEDLIAMNALYRPGPMEYIPSYINRKYGKEPIHYDLPEMEKYLKDTYGITVYQEQVMQLSQELAGFTKGQADSLRKAMGKKKKEVMDQQKEIFMEGCRKKEINERLAEKIWRDWEAFAQYAFNKSHSTCYAYISYQTAFLKAHYPAEYMSALLSRNLGDIKKISLFMDECKRMGLSVLGPDINESSMQFNVNKKGDIRFGLGAIKGVGEAAVADILEERNRTGSYKNIFDFSERINLQTVNKKSIEALAVSGAFDSFGMKRSQYFSVDSKNNTFTENLIRYGHKLKIEKSTSQQSLFGGNHDFSLPKPEVINCEEWEKLEKLNKEKELIGIYLSAHPLDDYRFELQRFCNATVAELNDLKQLNGNDICIAGIITDFTTATTKTGNMYGKAVLEDYTDSYKLTFFSEDFIKFNSYLKTGNCLLLKGKAQPSSFNNGELELRIIQMYHLSEVRNKLIKSLSLKLPLEEISDQFVSEIHHILDTSKGKIGLKFLIYDSAEKLWIEMLSKSHKIKLTDKLIKYLNEKSEIEFKIN